MALGTPPQAQRASMTLRRIIIDTVLFGRDALREWYAHVCSLCEHASVVGGGSNGLTAYITEEDGKR